MAGMKRYAGLGKMVKLHNRRVYLRPVEGIPGVSWHVKFKKLGEGRGIVVTEFLLSDEALNALFQLYADLSPDIHPCYPKGLRC